MRDLAGAPQLSAVIDWEMATLGDSLTDLGLLGLYWNINDLEGIPPGAVPSSVSEADGYPTFEQLVDEYSETAGGAGSRVAVVSRARGVQARGHPGGHPLPLPRRPDRRPRFSTRSDGSWIRSRAPAGRHLAGV